MKSTKCVRIAELTFAAALLLVSAAFSSQAQQAVPPTPQNGSSAATASAVAQPDLITPTGVENWGRVSSFLFRGAQPSREGFASLKSVGIDTVIDLRDEHGEIAKEQAAVEGLGMHFVSIPWNGRHVPTSEQMASFLAFFQTHPNAKVFVHCAQGRDRTGVMVAAYRMALENWTTDKAVDEMHTYHYHQFMLPHLRKYVESFPDQLKSDTNLQAVLAAAKATPMAGAASAVTH